MMLRHGARLTAHQLMAVRVVATILDQAKRKYFHLIPKDAAYALDNACDVFESYLKDDKGIFL